MPRACELTGLGVLSGNKVSHSKRKTRRKFLPNLQQVTLFSEALNQSIRFRIAAKTLRTVDFKGGLDGFLLKSQPKKLTVSAKSLRNKIKVTLEKDTSEEQKAVKAEVKKKVSDKPNKRVAKKLKAKEETVKKVSTKKATAPAPKAKVKKEEK
jgi:large subunit ribosomal protein L28